MIIYGGVYKLVFMDLCLEVGVEECQQARKKSGRQENKATENIGKRKNQEQLTCNDQNIILF